MVIAAAPYIFQHDARILHVQHPAVLFIHDMVNAPQYPINSSAPSEHLGIEQQASITTSTVKRGDNLLPGLDLNQFAGL